MGSIASECIILLIVILTVFLVHCVLSKALNACMQLLATRQIISLPLECQSWDEENGQLRDRYLNILSYDVQSEIQPDSNIKKEW